MTGPVKDIDQDTCLGNVSELDKVTELSEGGVTYRVYLPHKDKDYIQGRIVAEKHPYELEMLQDMASRLDKGDHVIDVGANVGNHTLYLAAVVGCHVAAYEPNPELCEAIRKSAQINGLEDLIEVHEVGVGATSGKGKFLELNETNLGAQRITSADTASAVFDIVKLDDLNATQTIRTIKIDVEGMEFDVLQGAEILIESYQPILYVECQTEDAFVVIYEWLTARGYCLWESFNATPTHLFIHGSQVVEQHHADRLLLKVVRENYRLTQYKFELREQLNDANKKYRTANERISLIKEKLDVANEKYRSSSEQASTIKQQLTQENTRLKEEKSQLMETNRIDESKWSAAHQKITDLENIVAKQSSRLDELVKHSDLFNERCFELQKKLCEANEKYRAANEQISSLKDKLDNANEKYRFSTEQGSTLKQQFAQESARLKEEKSLLASQYETSEKKLAEARQQIVEFEQKVAQQSTELYLATEKNSLTQERQQDIQNQLHEAKTKCRQADDRIENLQQRFEEVHEKYRLLLDQIDALKQLRTSEKVEFREEVVKIKERYFASHGEMQQSLGQDDSRKFARCLVDLTEEKRQFREKQEQLQKQLKEVVLKNEQLVKQQALDKSSLDKLAKQLDVANQKYREATGQHIPVLKERISAVTVHNGNHRQEIFKLTQQVKDLQLQKKRLEHRVSALQSSVSFKLGFALVSAVSSWRGLVRLPVSLSRVCGQGLSYLFRRYPGSAKSVLQSNQIANTENIILPDIGSTQARLSASLPVVEKRLPDKREIPGLRHSGSLKSLRVACIMDDFTFGSFNPECVLKQLTPDAWQSELESFGPELLFIESAWRGKDELWGSKVGHKSAEVRGIIDWCRERSIPTVFWNKEDPVHFQTFLNTAKLFDYVFTTDFDCIHRYKSALGHDRIYLLPFAAQPAVHNPIEHYSRKNAISFAGAYYARYPERTKDLESFIKTLPSFLPVEIYDRNYGKDHPDYQFPAEYQPYIVGTLPFDKIDLAYKGYQYAINLNSIKQSQTMFARRVFELLASNTITISNFSRGLRLLLGDLVITTDSGEQVVQRLKAVADSPDKAGKLKLAALRKIMQEHTYEVRLNYICKKMGLEESATNVLPVVVVVAQASDQVQADRIVEGFLAQTHLPKRLKIVVSGDIQRHYDEQVQYLSVEEARVNLLGDLMSDGAWLASMCTEDYYGPNYLTDAVLATRYSEAGIIGKASYFEGEAGNIRLEKAQEAYKPIKSLPVRRSIIRADLVRTENLLQWVDSMITREVTDAAGLAIDPYNYVANAQKIDLDLIKQQVDDLAALNIGLGIEELQKLAENISPAADSGPEEMLVPAQLKNLFGSCKSKKVEILADDEALKLRSNLADGKHEYLYATKDLKPEEISSNDELRFYLDSTPGLTISLVVLFLDQQKNRLNHCIFQANRNASVEVPYNTCWLRIGLRILSGGEANIKGLILGHRDLQPTELLGTSEHLLVTNHYPSYDDLYRNGFVHSRVRAYQDYHVPVDVFRLRLNETISYHEYENVDVVTGSKEALTCLLSSGRYKNVLVHFLDSDMWEVLAQFLNHINVIVWVHGAEIQPWYRRKFNFETEEQLELAKLKSDKRLAFWQSILDPMPENLRMVFVSQHIANEVMEDLGFRLPENKYHIIHNPIDTQLFSYVKKDPEQRKKILSIRPYASKIYANDLSVKMILDLMNDPDFSSLEIRIIGDGKLFEETLRPLQGKKNITLEKRFLTRAEIAHLHKEYGVFLCPSRMDSQGVSRDEAMSSGLVPVTNSVAAVSEFVDDSCAILAPPEDAKAMAEGMKKIINDPSLFCAMSKRAGERVRVQSSQDNLIKKEIQIFNIRNGSM